MSPDLKSVAALYEVFADYPAPAGLWVCQQCGPELTAAGVSATPLGSLTFEQLTAMHVMALDDDALRHYFPRLMELLLATPAPVFDFRVSDLKSRIGGWTPPERVAAEQLAESIWTAMLSNYPLDLGYFSDCASALDLLDWCGLPLVPRLDRLMATDLLPPASHLATLVDAVFTNAEPFETADKATVLDWLGAAAVGTRLQDAFFSAGSDAAARELSAAHQLWTACVPQR
jgi:hypothetical protein